MGLIFTFQISFNAHVAWTIGEIAIITTYTHRCFVFLWRMKGCWYSAVTLSGSQRYLNYILWAVKESRQHPTKWLLAHTKGCQSVGTQCGNDSEPITLFKNNFQVRNSVSRSLPSIEVSFSRCNFKVNGNTVSNVCRELPGGILIFLILPSQHQICSGPRARFHGPGVPGVSAHGGPLHRVQGHQEQPDDDRDHGWARHQHQPEEGRSHPPQTPGAQSSREGSLPWWDLQLSVGGLIYGAIMRFLLLPLVQIMSDNVTLKRWASL